ncbi:hypothetical protein AMJ50_01180 [Parcubacteria bacterium DG_74_3]|nr:MAG: hypothetical protein AMJ50_01180 [Parcubacteria bacterium DG_74_3]
MTIEKELSGIQKNVLLKNYTTFKIGGKTNYFYIAKSKKELIFAVKMAKKFRLSFFILGKGSKLLVSDEGFKGLVIKLEKVNCKLENEKIYAEAGVSLNRLVKMATENNLTGLEWAAGIPGTVGGAIRGNAGAFGSSIKDIVEKVEVYDVRNDKVKILKNKDCQFGYRESTFKKNPHLIILSSQFHLKGGDKKKITEKIKENLNYRKQRQPLEFPSAGSVFKNPPGDSAGELIEKCGLRGKQIGKIKISEKHANFIINLGNGRAGDVKKLIELIKKEVKKKFAIELEEEIQYLGFENP